MKTLLLHLWAQLRTSFWFVPSLLVVGGVMVAYGALALDRRWSSELLQWFPRLEEVSAEGVRSLLSTVATSVLTLAGVTFSATLVALTVASSQFGSRLLRNFIRSLPNQVTMGVLLGNFVLCLIVLRSARSADEFAGVPHVAAFVAFAVTLISLTTFIYFIHHIAVSLQADHIVATVYNELDSALESYFPDKRPDDSEERAADEDKQGWEDLEGERALKTSKSGYIQAVNVDGLVEAAAEKDFRCRVLHHPGQFVHAGAKVLALSEAAEEELSDSERRQIVANVLVGRIRTAEQDFEYGLRQLVEVALKALSPGINDPFTAMNCIDFLGAALAKVAKRRLPVRIFQDGDGKPRVLIRPTNFGDLLASAFHQIRQEAGDRPDIAIRMLEALGCIGESVVVSSHRDAVVEYAELIGGVALESVEVECDRKAIEEALERVIG